MKILLALIVLFFADSSLAQLSRITPDTPKDGEWAGFAPGTWVITRHHYSGAKYHQDGDEYQRELLVGVDADGKPWFSVDKAPEAKGPWKTSFGGGGARAWWEVKGAHATAAPDEEITVGSSRIKCKVYDIIVDHPDLVQRGRRWVDAATGIMIQSEYVTRPRNPKDGDWENRLDTSTIATGIMEYDGRVYPTLLQKITSSNKGTLSSLVEHELAIGLPGQRLRSRILNPADPSAKPTVTIEFVSFGFDAELLATYQKAHPDPGDASERRMDDAKRSSDARLEGKIAALSDPDFNKRATAVMQLQTWIVSTDSPRERLLSVFRNVLDHDSSFIPRRAAALALARMHAEGVAQKIVDLSAQDAEGLPDYVAALGSLGDSVGLKAVLDARTDTRPRVRCAAAEALGGFPTDEARLAAVGMLSDPHPTVRLGAVKALEQLKGAAVVPSLRKAIGDPDSLVRRYAIKALASVGGAAEIPAIAALLDERDEKVRTSVILALMSLSDSGQAGLTEPILKALHDPSGIVQSMAIVACTKLDDARITAQLLTMLDDPALDQVPTMMGTGLRESVLRVLFTKGDPKAFERVEQMLKDPATEERGYGVLSNSKSPAAARFAWKQLRLASASRGVHKSWNNFSQSVVAGADAALLKEIRESVVPAPLGEREMLRRLIARIEERMRQTPASAPATRPK